MIGLALAALAGGVATCFVPEGIQGRVRAVWTWLYRKVLPAQPNTAAPAKAARAVPQPLYAGSIGDARKPVDAVSAIGNIIAFVLRYWQIILLVLVFVGAAAFVKGCVHVPFVESREHAVTRANAAEGEMHTQLTINQRDAVISDIRTHVATARVTLQHLQEQGHAEIAAVTPPVEQPLPPDIVAAWRANIDRLCEFPRPDGTLPDSCSAGDPS